MHGLPSSSLGCVGSKTAHERLEALDAAGVAACRHESRKIRGEIRCARCSAHGIYTARGFQWQSHEEYLVGRA